LPNRKKLRSFPARKDLGQKILGEDRMSGLYIDLAVICGLGVIASLGGMYMILRATPSRSSDPEA
jgi:hypothetical protein